MTGGGARLPFRVERRDDAPDGAGGFAVTWQARGTVWGVLSARPGRERLSGGVGVSACTHVVRIRGAAVGAPSRPVPRDRLRLGTRIFDVVSVTEADPLGRAIDIRVVEETAS